MRKAFWALVIAIPMAMAACEATDETTDATTQTDQGPSCTATASNVYDGCMQFRDALCDRMVVCNIYGDMNECYGWFDNEEIGLGGCEETFTDPVASPAKFQQCICGMPTTNCQALSEQVDQVIPVCFEWMPAEE